MSTELGEMRRRLARILFKKSYLEGDFTLTSGRKSDYYFDCRQSSLNAEGAYLIGSIFVKMMGERLFRAVAGMTMGADPLVTATSLMAFQNNIIVPGLIVRKEIKAHGTARAIEGLANVQAGDPVLMVEDVVSTGGSVIKACKRVEEANLKVAGIFCILDREEGGREALLEAGYPLEAIFTRRELVALGKA